MSILFNGYYGYQNTGDDIFCLLAEWGAKKFWGAKKIKFFGRKLPLRKDNTTLQSGMSKRKYFKGQEVLEIFVSAGMSSKVIFAGGSLFHSKINPFSVKNIIAKYTKLGLVKTGALGVSLGPYENREAKESIKSFLSEFSFLAVRDRRSYEEAKDMQLNIPVIEAFDLAALLPQIYPVQKTSNTNPTLGVSICNYERYIDGDLKNEERRNAKIISSLKLLAKKVPNLEIKVFIFNAHPQFGDKSISNFLIEELHQNTSVERIEYHSNPIHMWNAISSCDLVLATRLHSGMFSCFSKTPFVQVEYHEKCSDFLDDINYPDKFRIGDIEISNEEVCEILFKLLMDESFVINNLNKIEERALRNFSSTKDLILR